jgi:hypothetical protein
VLNADYSYTFYCHRVSTQLQLNMFYICRPKSIGHDVSSVRLAGWKIAILLFMCCYQGNKIFIIIDVREQACKFSIRFLTMYQDSQSKYLLFS